MIICIRERTEVAGKSFAQQSQTAGSSSGDSSVGGALRRTLWSAAVGALNHSKFPYCLLGAASGTAELGDSDMDFVVRACDYPVIPQLLASSAASAGARLVQAIDHETTATYFALARQQGEVVAFLHPDCTTDYRRQGRLWMSSEELLRGRRRAPGGYFRPAPDVDFKYYLIKQVLKQTLSHAQWRKLVAFYEASPCPQEAFSLWRRGTGVQIEQSLLDNDRDAFREQLPHYNRELIATPSHETAVARSSLSLSLLDSARVVRRMARPTGLFVQISNGHIEERTELASKLAKALAPAFRRSSVVASRHLAQVMRALIESTLMVSPEELIPVRTLYGGVDIHWQPALTPAKNFECAVVAILSHLTQRTMRRLELQLPQAPRSEFDTLADTTVF